MDANDWFNNLYQSPRPFANNNEWADSIGGPIKKDKLFFFVDNEGIRYIVPSTQQVYSPTPHYVAATLANLAANDPAALPIYQQLFHFYQTAPGYSGSTAFGTGDGGCGIPGFAPGENCFGSYQSSPALPGTEWLPGRTRGLQPVGQRSLVLAGKDGSRHAGHRGRSHQQRLQRSQLSAFV